MEHWRVVALRAMQEWFALGVPHGSDDAIRSYAVRMHAVRAGSEQVADMALDEFDIELADHNACYCYRCGAIIVENEGVTDENGDPTCDTCAELTRGAK